MSKVLTDSPAQHVARVLINRPDANNALDFETRELLIEAFETLNGDAGVRAIILGGTGGLLSAGGDIPSMADLSESDARERMRHGRQLCNVVAATSRPVVVAVERMGVGNCMGLAMLADHIVMGEVAFVMFPFLKIGLIPDWGILRSLPRRVGLARARRMLMTGERVDAAEALRINLVDEVVADGEVMARAIERASEFAMLPVEAFGSMKARLGMMTATLDEELFSEEDNQASALLHEEFREGLAAFQQKRAPNFVNVGLTENDSVEDR